MLGRSLVPDDVPRETREPHDSVDPSSSEAAQVYLRFKAIFGDPNMRRSRGRKRIESIAGSSIPFGVGRDPHGLGDTISSLTRQLGWNSPLAQSELLASWVELAGEETANHSTPAGIDDGVLTVHCESTAWATQLRLMRNVIMEHVSNRFPDAGIQSIRFQGPNAPSWKKGPRSIPGRGPRDTYG